MPVTRQPAMRPTVCNDQQQQLSGTNSADSALVYVMGASVHNDLTRPTHWQTGNLERCRAGPALNTLDAPALGAQWMPCSVGVGR